MSVNHIPQGVLIGRAKVPGIAHPVVVTVRDGQLVDITAPGLATVRDYAESADPAGLVSKAKGRQSLPIRLLAPARPICPHCWLPSTCRQSRLQA